MDDDAVVRRIEGAVGAPGLVDALAALPAADVTSLRGGLLPEQLEDRVLAPLRGRFPDVLFGLEPARQGGEPGYYVRACFGLWSGEVNLADGGFTDWCARLLGDRKERVLTSGIGLDRLVG